MAMSDLFRVWDPDGAVTVFTDELKCRCLWMGRMHNIPFELMDLRVSRIRGSRIYVEVD